MSSFEYSDLHDWTSKLLSLLRNLISMDLESCTAFIFRCLKGLSEVPIDTNNSSHMLAMPSHVISRYAACIGSGMATCDCFGLGDGRFTKSERSSSVRIDNSIRDRSDQ